MSAPGRGAPPYRVVYSELCRERARDLLARAAAQGRLAEVARAVRDLDRRLHWIPLDFGEPFQDLAELGLKEHIGVVTPLVVRYSVDEGRRLVYVAVPFRLLPRAGL